MTTNEPDQSNSEVISRDPVSLPLVVTVGDLAEILQESQVDVVKALMKLGVMASVNEEVDFSLFINVKIPWDAIGVLLSIYEFIFFCMV